MKRLITLILAIALCVPLYIPAQAEFQYDLSEYSLLLNIKDVYPIQPGTEEWKKLETLQSKIAACEIPKETLHRMSTESLIEAVLYYPLLSNMYAYLKAVILFGRHKSEIRRETDFFAKGKRLIANEIGGDDECIQAGYFKMGGGSSSSVYR